MKSGRAALLIFLTLGVLVPPLTAEAQEAGRVHRIGILSPEVLPPGPLEVFQEGLRELGYVEGGPSPTRGASGPMPCS
jgi:hypothetical protein